MPNHEPLTPFLAAITKCLNSERRQYRPPATPTHACRHPRHGPCLTLEEKAAPKLWARRTVGRGAPPRCRNFFPRAPFQGGPFDCPPQPSKKCRIFRPATRQTGAAEQPHITRRGLRCKSKSTSRKYSLANTTIKKPAECDDNVNTQIKMCQLVKNESYCLTPLLLTDSHNV